MKSLSGLCAAFAVSLSLWMASSCGPIPDYRTLTGVDLHPPEFLGILAVDRRTVVVRFDEEVRALPKATHLRPRFAISSVEARGKELFVTLAEDQGIGIAYTLEAAVEDVGGNSTSVIAPFYGYNPDPPRMVINEFTTQGSATHPDLVELAVIREGNTAGICLYEGMPSNWDDRELLPAIEVEKGDYLLVHFKPQGLAEEIDEIEATDLSGGLDASPAAHDLWVEGGDGLSGNNGVLALYSCPGGVILDAVVYSNRTSASDTTYAGFGSRDVHERVIALEETGEWKHAGPHLAPEDAVDPEPSTATRSIARASGSRDTNDRSDWHITPTGGSTFGVPNSDEVYRP